MNLRKVSINLIFFLLVSSNFSIPRKNLDNEIIKNKKKLKNQKNYKNYKKINNHDFNIGDCGSTKVDRFIALEQYGKANFNLACQHHDIFYENCEETKSNCDLIFKNELNVECEKNFLLFKLTCKIMARVFFTGVDKFGQDAYDRSMDKYCPKREY